MFDAIEAGNLEELEALLAAEAGRCLWNERDESPLHLAARTGRVEMVRLLIENGQEVALKERYRDDSSALRRTPLDLAKAHGQEGAARILELTAELLQEGVKDRGRIRELLGGGAIVKARGYMGVTALHTAARQGDLDGLSLLLEHGADVDALDKYGKTPLSEAANRETADLLLDGGATLFGRVLQEHAAMGRLALVQWCIDNGMDIKVRRKNGETPLHQAAGNNHMDVAGLLLKHGADCDARGGDSGETPLHTAVRYGGVGMLLLLLEGGGKRDLTNDDGLTPLELAEKRGNRSAALVLSGDTSPQARLVFAIHQGDQQQAAAILEEDIAALDMAYRDQDGGTLALYAVKAPDDRDGILRLLVKAGADLDWRSPGGMTLLHQAAQSGNSSIAAFLIDEGLTMEAANEFGMTPLHMAARDGHVEVVKILLEKGADPEAASRDGRTPREWTGNGGIRQLLGEG